MHSTTGNVSALRHDLRNGPRHCFGDHQSCNICSLSHTDSLPFDKFPPDFIDVVESCGDRLVSKATQLISCNKTTDILHCMSIRCKMEGGKYFNRVQSVSFQHRSMAAALKSAIWGWLDNKYLESNWHPVTVTR